MKLDSACAADDGEYHQYCWGCHAERMTWVRVDGRSAWLTLTAPIIEK